MYQMSLNLPLGNFIPTNNPRVLLSNKAYSSNTAFHRQGVVSTEREQLGWVYMIPKSRKWVAQTEEGVRSYHKTKELAIAKFEKLYSGELYTILKESGISLEK